MDTPKKPRKAPSFYKKQITEKKLEKRYLKHIEVPMDKSFIKDCYTKQDEKYIIRTDLNAIEVKRLRALSIAIRKNRKGPINFFPLLLLAAFAVASAIFFITFANPLLSRALELGLEEVFEAKVDVNRFRLSFIDFEISMNGLTIADKDKPMQNLIQLDKTRIKLKPNAVLRGKIYIEEIRADAIRFGTPRTVSGLIPGRVLRQPTEPEPFEIEIPQMIDLANFDARALLDQELDKLQTIKMYNEAIDSFNSASQKWKEQADNARARVGELQDQAKPLLDIRASDFSLDMNFNSIDVSGVRDIASVRATAVSAAESSRRNNRKNTDQRFPDRNTYKHGPAICG